MTSLCIDLHCHSTYSDGTLSPQHLVERAHQNGVDVLALTDHDSTNGLADARQVAQDLGIRLINGVEISVTWNQTVLHIVGLNIDPNHTTLVAGLAELQLKRIERTQQIAAKLEKCGIDQVLADVTALAGSAAATRTHFARLLVQRNIAKDNQKAFKQWLGRGARAYVHSEWTGLAEAVAWINGAGGQAVIAHPARYKMTAGRLSVLLTEFKALGGVGMEVVSGNSHPSDRENMARLTQKIGLLASVGSDFHSPDNVWNDLGAKLALPTACHPIWQDWDLSV